MSDKTSRIEAAVNAENKPGLGHLLRLWKFVFSSAKIMSLIFICLMFLLSILRPVAALIWGKYIDRASSFLPGGELIPLILLVALYYLLSFVINLLWRYTEGWESIEKLDFVQTNRFQELVNSRVLKKLSDVDPEYWEVPKINDTTDRTFKFLNDKWDGMSRGVMYQGYLVLAKAVSVISIAASLYIFSPWLCFIILLAPLPSLYSLSFSEKLRFKFVKENAVLQRRAEYYQNVLLRTGAKEVKTMGLFDFFFAKWKKEMDEYTIKEKRLYRNQLLINMGNSLFTSGANIGANILAICLMAAGRITLGALGACMSLTSALLNDTNALITSVAAFLSKKNEAALFYDLMDLKDREGTNKCENIDNIRAKHISYRYPLTDKYVLDGIDFDIKKGEKIALVGENGAGKTTFVKIITGILSQSEGELYINGCLTEETELESRLDKMSTVSQNPARYQTFTVEENILIGDTLKPESKDDLAQAMSFAGAEDVPGTALLGKEIGGTELSGGQWQKLAIARAAYRNRDFIILDEPTSNLDPLAESEVFKKYMELAKDKTVVFVTHRISIAALAERIIVFDGSRIAEEGTHDYLLSLNGTYAKLYNEQAKWYNR